MSNRIAMTAIAGLGFAVAACSSTSNAPAPQRTPGAPLPPAGAAGTAAPGVATGGFAGIGSGGPGTVAAGGGGSCNAGAASFLVGQLANVQATEQAEQATGAEDVRILYPGQPVTQEFIPTRVTLDTNNQNEITSVRCG